MPKAQQLLHSDITEKILACVHTVYATLGSGFTEKLYENALVVELQARGLNFVQQHPIKVHYKRILIGEYVADLLVEGKVIVELKAVETLSEVHDAQLLNYLKATGIRVGLLINFHGLKPLCKRRIV